MISYLKEFGYRLKASSLLQGILLILMGITIILVVYAPNRFVKSSEAVPAKQDSVNLSEAFRLTLDTLRLSYGFPGATAAYVWTDGKSGVAATGFSDLESGTPMTPKSRMLAASIGKTFVGAAAVLLSDEGVLDLDEPIERRLGKRQWFQRLPNHKQITLRHLLTHRSGLPNHVYMDEFAAEASRRWPTLDEPISPDSLVQFVLDEPPLFDAGEGWSYTDTGFILAGMIIEQATGRSYYEIIEERFLNPLNLRLTSPSNTRTLPRLAAGYAAENAFGFPKKTTTADGEMAWHPGIEWTGGGLVSTSEDLARWGAALFGGRALSKTALERLLHSSPIDSASPDIHYGMGIAIYQNTSYGTVYGHGGWIPGYTSSLRYYKDYGVAIAFQINTDIGIMDDTSSVVQTMESKLAAVVLSAKDRFGRK